MSDAEEIAPIFDSEQPRSSSAVPSRIGKYGIVRELSRGGMGIVYEAEDPTLGRRVALKVLGGWLAGDPEARRRLETEARILAKLQHSGIVQVFDADRVDDSFFFAMEFIQGKPLSEWLEQRQYLPAEVMEIGVQVSGALRLAHGSGIIHRDLKPSNLLSEDGVIVKVADFGLSRTADSRLTKTGAIMGTPMYMAPEQVLGTQPTTATDVYSLGIVLYELLTGHPPFSGDSPFELAIQHVQDEPPDLRELDSAAPWGLRDLTMRCLAKSPEDRPGLAELGSSLTTLLQTHRSLQGVLSQLQDIAPNDFSSPFGVGEEFRSTWAVVLTADASGFRSIYESTAPRHVGRFLSRIQEVMRTSVESVGGHIVKFMADSCLAVFVHEDKAAAVTAALEAAAALGDQIASIETGVTNLDVCIGIHGGDVLVGPTWDGRDHTLEVLGDNVNIAVRIEHLGQAGKILASQGIVDLAPPGWIAERWGELEPRPGKSLELFSLRRHG